MLKTDVLIIGAGITGLSAGAILGKRATVLEKNTIAGGTAQSHVFGDYWFDHTVHFLLMEDKGLLHWVKSLMGDSLKFSPLVVWVNTSEGRVRYPFQLNLGGLPKEKQMKCLYDFCSVYFNQGEINSYRDFLLNTFGQSMCDIFFFPYNEKSWKYPLDEMDGSGQTWNIHKPTPRDIMEGMKEPNKTRGDFNTQGYYPIPPKGQTPRGIKLLSHALADEVYNIIYDAEVVNIDIKSKCVTFTDGNKFGYYYYNKLLSTIPLPQLMWLCAPPERLKRDVNTLKWISMQSIVVSVKGKRTSDCHYEYFSDTKIPFNKVTYTTEFDPYSAPDDGYGLLLEVKDSNYPENIIDILYETKVLKRDDKVVDVNSWIVDPAYVVFTKNTHRIVADCHEWLQSNNITSLGRYGNWEYSSMAKNIKDGVEYATQLL